MNKYWIIAIVSLLLAIVAFFIYDRCAGEYTWEEGIASQYIHHEAWDEYKAAYTTTHSHADTKGHTTTHTEFHPSRTIHHPAYDETPVVYPSGQWILAGKVPKGTRFSITLTIGKVTGWKYQSKIQEAK